MKPVNQPDVVEQFAHLVRQHDVSYEYSDDYRVWDAGQRQRHEILNLYRSQDHRTRCLMVDVWNEIMERKFTANAFELWQWSYPQEAA